MYRRFLFPLLLLLLAGLMLACDIENNGPTAPEPINMDDMTGQASCTKPTATAVVTPASSTPTADYSDNTRDVNYRSWTFAGGSPPTSDQRAGSVTYPEAGSYQWTLRVCRDSATDPEDCCDSVGGTIVIQDGQQ